ncbi:hypothetical protein SO802_007746 [Lithocarpus litseifolius]|uniref:HAT C-terminal dimerisation domain-containing protein n=1 Tax=Lithocarpus litseifolius TaxID=425828 RepID=A0AAW2DSW3_9ROSI
MCLRERGVDGIFTLTVDNVSSNGATIKFLQTVTKDWKGTVLEHEFLHMRCCAHILNLIMGDGLKEIDASIARVREAVRTFVGFLKLFYNATKKFSSSLYVTSNTFIDEMFVIQENIAHLIKSQNHLLKNMTTKMEAKFEKYWEKGDKINQLLYVAMVLDPRKKMRFLKFSFLEIFGDEMANEMVDLVRKTMDRLYDYYSCVDSPNVVVPSESERKHIEDRYQVLSKMARDVLAVPVSTVAFESAFSTRGRILDPFLLSPLMVQNLVCAQNWLQAHVPISFRKSKDEMEALEDIFHDLVLNQATTAANSSSCSSKGGTRTTVSIDE